MAKRIPITLCYMLFASIYFFSSVVIHASGQTLNPTRKPTLIPTLIPSRLPSPSSETRVVADVFSEKSAAHPSLWMEVGTLLIDDKAWTAVTSVLTSFQQPQVFISIPSYDNGGASNSAAISIRISNKTQISKGNSVVTFRVKVKN